MVVTTAQAVPGAVQSLNHRKTGWKGSQEGWPSLQLEAGLTPMLLLLSHRFLYPKNRFLYPKNLQHGDCTTFLGDVFYNPCSADCWKLLFKHLLTPTSCRTLRSKRSHISLFYTANVHLLSQVCPFSPSQITTMRFALAACLLQGKILRQNEVTEVFNDLEGLGRIAPRFQVAGTVHTLLHLWEWHCRDD